MKAILQFLGFCLGCLVLIALFYAIIAALWVGLVVAGVVIGIVVVLLGFSNMYDYIKSFFVKSKIEKYRRGRCAHKMNDRAITHRGVHCNNCGQRL